MSNFKQNVNLSNDLSLQTLERKAIKNSSVAGLLFGILCGYTLSFVDPIIGIFGGLILAVGGFELSFKYWFARELYKFLDLNSSVFLKIQFYFSKNNNFQKESTQYTDIDYVAYQANTSNQLLNISNGNPPLDYLI